MGTIEKALIYLQGRLDTQMIAGAATGWMEDNAVRVQYNGGNAVKIAKISNLVGLGDYVRGVGYAPGAFDLAWETLTMTKDRSRSFTIDRMDNDETAFILTATNLMGEFQRRFVAPEIDSYRIAAIYDKAHSAGNYTSYNPNVADIWDALAQDISRVQDTIGESVPLVIMMNYGTARILDTADKIQKRIEVGNFAQGGVSIKVRMIDEIPILRVPSARMKTAYTFDVGATPTAGGFAAAGGAGGINWLIVPKIAPIAISKTDKMKVFDPDTNQSADGWLIQYRKYHDLWYEDGNLAGLWGSLQSADEAVPSVILITPANAAIGILTDATISFKFSESVYDGPAMLSGIVLKTIAGVDKAFTASIVGDTLILTPTTVLVSGTEYQCSIAPAVVQDGSGNVNEDSRSITFTIA